MVAWRYLAPEYMLPPDGRILRCASKATVADDVEERRAQERGRAGLLYMSSLPPVLGAHPGESQAPDYSQESECVVRGGLGGVRIFHERRAPIGRSHSTRCVVSM